MRVEWWWFGFGQRRALMFAAALCICLRFPGRIADPCNDPCNGEQDVEQDQNNEPRIKMTELNENRTARHGHIGDELSKEDESEGLPPHPVAPEPPPDWPEEKTAPVNHDTQRGQENIKEGIVHCDGGRLTRLLDEEGQTRSLRRRRRTFVFMSPRYRRINGKSKRVRV